MMKINKLAVAILTVGIMAVLGSALHAQSSASVSADHPLTSTFWSMQKTNYAPLPYNPFPDLPLYELDDGSYLMDDRSADYDQLWKDAAEKAEGMFDVEEGGNGPLDYRPGELWLEITAVTNDFAFVTLHNTVTNKPYSLLTKANLTWSNWTPELRVTGVPGNATPAQLATRERTNLYVWARTCTSSNLAVDTSPTAEQLARLLVGTCVTISNVIYTGSNVARGTFTNGICSGLPIDSGVSLSSGYISNAIGTNNDSGSLSGAALGRANDDNLDQLVGGSDTVDAAVLEFDIVSTNSFILQFEYIFASEEYPECIGLYNDPMAIFVSTNYNGTNWIYTNNIALVPGTSNLQVSVSTINGGCLSSVFGNYISPTNPQYYADNDDPHYSAVRPYAGASQVYNIQYDGTTTCLKAQIPITAGITNRVKIAIADYLDPGYDSAVFIKAAPQCP